MKFTWNHGVFVLFIVFDFVFVCLFVCLFVVVSLGWGGIFYRLGGKRNFKFIQYTKYKFESF
jgi:hypothetical protein